MNLSDVSASLDHLDDARFAELHGTRFFVVPKMFFGAAFPETRTLSGAQTIDNIRAEALASMLLVPLRARDPAAATFTLGRSGENDVVIVHPTVSKVHARFRTDHAGLFVADAGSRNGTYVADAKLTANSGELLVPSGSDLCFGTVGGHYFDVAGLRRFIREPLAY